MVNKTVTTGIMVLLLLTMAAVVSAGPDAPADVALASLSEATPTLPLSLSQVKVACVYERVSDGIAFGRDTNGLVTIFNETGTDLIFRGFFRWEPVPESAGASLPGYSASYVKGKANTGYTYQQLGDSIRQIKAARPQTLFIGAIAAQRLNRNEINDITGEAVSPSQTWAMALDPAKFGIAGMNKTMTQCTFAVAQGWLDPKTRCPSGYDRTIVPAYVPDITNEQYQDLLVSYAQKQIDLGADGIWIDMLYSQASYLAQVTGNSGDPTVRESYDAASGVIDRIHEYGTTKYGRHISVGTWGTFATFPYPAPSVDFVTATPTPQELKSGLRSTTWISQKNSLARKTGGVPLIAFIDWNNSASSPMGTFSQSLTSEQQKAWLTSTDATFTANGIIFAYPVHGGTFPMNSKVLTYGKYNIYDSLAPQFGTYDTIRTLARKKSAG